MQQGFIPFLPYGGFAPPQPTPQQMAQAMMQQQAAAAMFGNGQPGMPALGNGQPDRMFPPSGMEQAMAMRNMQFAQAMAAMMGFQVCITAFRNACLEIFCQSFGPSLVVLLSGRRLRDAQLRTLQRAVVVGALQAAIDVHLYYCRVVEACPSMLEGPSREAPAPCSLGRRAFLGRPARATCQLWAAWPMQQWAQSMDSVQAARGLNCHLETVEVREMAGSSAPLTSRCSGSRRAGSILQVCCILITYHLVQNHEAWKVLRLHTLSIHCSSRDNASELPVMIQMQGRWVQRGWVPPPLYQSSSRKGHWGSRTRWLAPSKASAMSTADTGACTGRRPPWRAHLSPVSSSAPPVNQGHPYCCALLCCGSTPELSRGLAA